MATSLLAACGPPAYIELVVNSEVDRVSQEPLLSIAQLDTLRVRISGAQGGRTLLDSSYSLSELEHDFPVIIVLEPDGGVASDLEFADSPCRSQCWSEVGDRLVCKLVSFGSRSSLRSALFPSFAAVAATSNCWKHACGNRKMRSQRRTIGCRLNPNNWRSLGGLNGCWNRRSRRSVAEPWLPNR